MSSVIPALPARRRIFVDRRRWLTGLAYLCVAAIITAGWLVHDRRIIVASEGLGYALGIIGSSMMLLLMLYPVRKRAKFLRNAGPVSLWFRIHMMLGIAGPVLVLFHSNFSLGSVNSRVALFCTLIVASSGILGRYLYAKIHYGLYGQRATLATIREDIEKMAATAGPLKDIVLTVNDRLGPLENRVSATGNGTLTSFLLAISITFTLALHKFSIRRELKHKIAVLAEQSPVVAANASRLGLNSRRYLNRRMSALRKFAQLRACERLFSLWHIVHYPLFMVMVVAAIVHILAVHMY